MTARSLWVWINADRADIGGRAGANRSLDTVWLAAGLTRDQQLDNLRWALDQLGVEHAPPGRTHRSGLRIVDGGAR